MKKVFLIICFAMILLSSNSVNAQIKTAHTMPKQLFPIGKKLSESAAKNFIGQAYLAPLTSLKELNVPVSNVTFEPGCRNKWHSHKAGQLLIATVGVGYYQEKGKPAQKLMPGDVVEIAPDVVHWHGAASDSWFAHLAVTCNPQTNKTTWLQAVDDVRYAETTATAEATVVITATPVDTLNKKQQSIVTISAYTGKGDLYSLKTAFAEGLDAGMTINEIKEVLVQLYAYCGFPRSLRGLQTFMEVVEARKAAGIKDVEGREATPVKNDQSRYERGRDILTKLTGVSADAPKAGYAEFAPMIEQFLKEHLFADIFERDILTYSERELATVSALIGVGGVEPMLRSHMGITLRQDITAAQLKQAIKRLENSIEREKINVAYAVLEEVTGNNKPNVVNGVTIQKVSFRNRMSINVVGNLYLPVGYDKNEKHAAIVVGHPFGGVKEQTSGLHAQKMAELGYITLAFDASFYGESGGEPRRIEVPEIRVEDFSAAVDFLSNHPLVDKERIGVIGICGGGCYSVSAAQIDHRIKALATISMYDMGRARRQGVGDGTTYEQRMATLNQIGKQRTAEFGGASRKDIRALPEKVDASTPQYAREFLEYYDNTKRGQHPNSTAYYSQTSLAPMMNFFPFVQIETISPRPLLFIAGEKAVSKYFSEDAYNKAAQPKELFVVPRATHVDLYDQPKYLKITLSKLDSFFKQHLK